jgi:hypothetical protein
MCDGSLGVLSFYYNMKPTKRKAFNFLRSYFDVFNELKEDKDKLEFLTSIINKQFLNEDPKDLSFIVKLCYESQRHSIESSVKGWLRVSNTDVLGNTTIDPTIDPTTNPMTNPTTNPQEEEEKEEVEVKEKEKEENINTALPFSFYNSLISLGAKKELVSDWIKVRKNKKLTNTQTAFNKFVSQYNKSGYTINEVLEKCVEKSWGGFDADWFSKVKKQNTRIPLKF